MKHILGIIIVIILLIGLPIKCMAQLFHPLGGDAFSFEYERIVRIGIDRQQLEYLSPIGPYSIRTIRNAESERISPTLRLLDPLSVQVSGAADDRMILAALAAERYRTARGVRGDDLPSLTGGFSYYPGSHFGAAVFVNLDRARAVDPEYTGKVYRGLAGGIETAVLGFQKGRISMTLGRQRIFWGPQRINLLISETAEPLDLLSASYRTRRLTFSFLFARLDGSRPDEIDSLRFPDDRFKDNRYLVGHRLDLNLHRTLRVGLFETVLFGGEGRPPELYYLNPLQFFHAAQLNENEDDNTILGVDFTFLPAKGVCAYGQFLVDDFQIDDETAGDREPNEWGVMIGMRTAGRIASPIPDIKLEYTRLSNRTYHQRIPRNRYLYRNQLIGHPLGPDADSVALSLRFWPHEPFYSEIEFAYCRKGEGSIHKPWDEPWLLTTGDYDESFPTGTVERSILIALRMSGFVPFSEYTRNHVFISVDAGWGEIRNYLNVEGAFKTGARIDAAVTWMGFLNLSAE